MPVSKHASREVLPDNLLDHRALKAWRRIQPESFEPRNIEVLKLTKKKSAVYRLTGVGPNGSAVIAKRVWTKTATVERIVYQTVLPRLSLPALSCYGFVPDPEDEFCWLFLEDAGGHPYWQDSSEHRAVAGRWLATVHRVARATDLHEQLPGRGPSHYLQLLRSTRTDLLEQAANPVLSAGEVSLLQTVAAHYDVAEGRWGELERFCDGVPRTLVHGDFAIKNLRVQPSPSGPALLVYDWEMAGWGFPATDLAQIEKCARVDLEAYHSVTREDLPHLDVCDIRRLAGYGNLLRVLDTIFWATFSWTAPAGAGDPYRFLAKPLLLVRKYEPQLATALHAVNWS